MKIKTAKFLKAITPSSPLPEKLEPLFAFIGRSNVGKSSLINSITDKKDLCRSGGKPGVTKTVNLFLINQNTYFADLPGYGYAKVSKGDRKTLESIIFWFFENREITIKNIFVLIDSRIGPTEQDEEMIDYLIDNSFQITLILSKTDKIKSHEKQKLIQELQANYPKQKIIPFSIKEKEGKKEILNTLV